jgi:DNA-binding NarL/FixJ family response regulator
VTDKIREILEHPFKNSGLSPSEIEVLEVALRGKTNIIISVEIRKSLPTVNTLMFRGLGKLGISKSELGWWVLEKLREVLE